MQGVWMSEDVILLAVQADDTGVRDILCAFII